ncbi:Pc16g13310 [Penicillium rubens Wisconsin 54-1255]|uniref:Pc16g13310 protein n=1 Tax=Penicillium rubens (strain ATCC 28089 / DSM 1075 / NRRL 1951 / Wisconsin 54-1255) TaxID=500485 RepID=B6HAM2_PENRW|nr:Pc16g13310 [Penicillium rubens Wisconsin 54-1255]
MSMSIEDCAQSREGFPRPFPDTPSNVLEQFKMNGKVVVVTGAADGLGHAIAQSMAEAGAHVALWYNSNDVAIEKAQVLAKEHDVKASAYKVDVSESTRVSETITKVVADFGKIDVFVANAVDGIVYCAKYAGEVFARQGHGNLIITSSMSAHIVNVPTDQPVYNATKAYVTHFGKSLAREWRDFARVNIVSPGFFDTKMGAGPSALQEAYRMSSLGRQGHVKEIKGLYLYLASDASTFMTGSDVLIDGGYVLP